MKEFALITGASRGIGAEFARLFASNRINLVLTARSESELQCIKDALVHEFGIHVFIFVADLTLDNEPLKLYQAIENEGIKISYLVNNAGFGDYGPFLDTPWERQRQMVDLNVISLMHLCYLFANKWKDRKSGRILNIASTAAFQPGPNMSVYFASKAFVASFSQALSYELKDHNITVTALCPGPTSSNFGQAANVVKTNKLFNNRTVAKASQVAQIGYNAMMKGKSLVVHGVINKVVLGIIRFIPRQALLKLSGKIISW